MNNCIVCDHITEPFCNRGQYRIYKCQSCGFGFTKNSNLQLSDYHRDDEYIQEEKLFENIFQKRVNVISGLLNPGKVLEIGCSTGLLLSMLKARNWDVLGVEMSKKSADAAKSRGIKIIVNSFENVKFDQKFDLIILNHVLEHLENPKEVLKKAYSILDPNGAILISLPNFGSLSAIVQKCNWKLLLPEEHLWQFTYDSLNILFKKIGLKTIYWDASSGIWDYGNPVLGLWNSLINMKKRFFIEIVTALPDFIFTKLKLGSGLIIIARKK